VVGPHEVDDAQPEVQIRLDDKQRVVDHCLFFQEIGVLLQDANSLIVE
jgi:hypothetical protein